MAGSSTLPRARHPSSRALPGGAEAGGQRDPLAFCHRADRLCLLHAQRREEPAAAQGAPVPLTGQDVADRHALPLPLVEQDHLGGAQIAVGDALLERGPGMPYPVGARERIEALIAPAVTSPRVHLGTSNSWRGWLASTVPTRNGARELG